MKRFLCLLLVVFSLAVKMSHAQYDPHPRGTYYNEPFRGQFHFSPKTEWMNDVNALIYLDGKYHMIYQWGKKIRHGGYATSKDLLHWKDEGVALIPQETFLPKAAARNVSGAQVYSGSGVVVSGPTAEKITGSPKEAMVAIYTGTKCGTCLAWSNDGGATWHDYRKNPVANPTGGANPRDPCVFMYEPTRTWILAIYEKGTTFYGSKDLIKWEKLSNINFGYECPDMFELPLDGDKNKMKWILQDANGSYLVGRFDGKTFTPEQEKLVMDVGPDFYAAQTFYRPNMPTEALIQIAWNDHWNGGIGEKPWERNATFPVAVGLVTYEGKMRITRTPIPAIKTLYKKTRAWQNKTITEAAKGGNLFKGITSKAFDLTVQFDLTGATARAITFKIANRVITYDIAKQTLLGKALKPDAQGRLTIRMLVDWGQLEVFSAGGVFSYSQQFPFTPDDASLSLHADGGEVKLVSMALHDVAGTWPDADEQAAVPAPLNKPATMEWTPATGQLKLFYNEAEILDAQVTAVDAQGKAVDGGVVLLAPKIETSGEKVTQRLRLSVNTSRQDVSLLVKAAVSGSEEAFPAETQSEAQKRFPYVRNSVGMSRNLRNNAVYDRRWDWVVSGPADGKTKIEPMGEKKERMRFSLESRGKTIELTFKPRFYQKHHGFKYFEPWTYKVWKGSLTGYCTWWAYRHSFTQDVLDDMLKLFVEKRLPDFGYDYMQFDDAYQHGNGSCPENWLNWNKKFPGGWRYAIKAIRDAGMKPGIWVHRIHRPSDPHVKDIAAAHPDWFVRKADGSLVMHHGFYMLNTTHPEAVENMIRKLYRGLAEQGWDYVKIDGTGDLLRAYQNKLCTDFFKTHPTTPEASLRAWDVVAREELGPDVYILACHTVGNARKVIGLVDGARLSNDGFQPRTLAQYNHLEGVLWRGDADHCDILGMWYMDEDARMPVFGVKEPVLARTVIRPAVCTMSGSVLMLSDKVEAYRDDGNIEGMKRSAPVLDTVPGQLYGNGRVAMPWWLQEIDRPFDHWSVLARIQWGVKREKEWVFDYRGMPEKEIKFADIGLPDDREYVVFEFWSQTFLGRCRGAFTAPAMDENNGMQVFAIREARPHPWVLSTTRHLTQGGVSLLDEAWDGKKKILSGKSALVIEDPYVLTVHTPAGFRVARVEVDGEKAAFTQQAEIAKVSVTPSASRTASWKIYFMSDTAPAGKKVQAAIQRPPMGWNSYTGYSIAVTEAELLKNIDYLSEHLLRYGYDTVTVDNGWFLSGQGKGITMALDEYGRPESHPHFFPRGLKYVIDYAHKRGVKFGIWLLRGINRRAVDENLPVAGTKYRMQDIVNRKSRCPWAIAPWWNYGVDMTKPGAQAYYDGLIRKYAVMGVDFIKFDDIVPNPDEVAAVAKAIARCGRRIILSLSPGDHIKVAHSDAYKKANMVRITSDIWDHRGSLETTFRRWEAMQDYTGPAMGSFLDMDMICFGRLYVTGKNGGWDCKFTEAQKRTFMVQRALAASPLMLGGVLYSMDKFSLGLFSHPEILACNRNAVIGKLVHRAGKVDVWKTPALGGGDSGWIGIFNRDGKAKATVGVDLPMLGLKGNKQYAITDIWTGKPLSVGSRHSFEIPPDGVIFLRYR